MSFFRRLFSSDYRRAVAAEAAGDFITAARRYALSGDRLKVAQMHVARARVEEELDPRIKALRTALGFTEEGEPYRLTVSSLLGRALRDRARELGDQTHDGRRALEQAARQFEYGQCWEEAGDCLASLGDRNRAATNYSRAGLVERVEQVLAQQEQDRDRRRREDDLFKDYELLVQGGQRDEALEAIRRCVDVADHKGDLRRLRDRLDERILRGWRVELQLPGERRLVLVGRFPLWLGREEDCDIRVRGPSVSRRHARILDDGAGGFTVEDAGSHNGTLLNGLRIGAPMPLTGEGTLALGNACALEFHVDPEPPRLRLSVATGLDKGQLAFAGTGPFELPRLVDGAPPLVVTFDDGRPMARAGEGTLRLGGARTAGSVQLIRGDRLRLGEQRVKVSG